MPKSQVSILRERLDRLLRLDGRFVDCAARLAVYERGPDGRAVKAHLRPTVFGGVYDRHRRCYVYGEETMPGGMVRRYLHLPETIYEIPCHAQQLVLLEHKRPGVMRVVALGAMGAGKSEAIVARALINCLKRPNTNGGLVAPISNQRTTVWDKFIKLAGPMGLVADVSHSRKQIRLVNGCVIDVLSAKRQTKDRGSPMQGKSWDWCCIDESSSVDDESHAEIAARGRSNAERYVIYEATTNDDFSHFVLRLERMKLQPARYEILKFYGHGNPWVPLEQWERLKSEIPSEREYRRKVLLEDAPRERLVYPRFFVATHLRPRPAAGEDITRKVTEDVLGRPYSFVMAQDFGALVTTTVVLKRYVEGWWALDEITTRQEYSDRHARLLKKQYNPEDFIVIADPHFNVKESDRSDYALFRNEGLTIIKAHDEQIRRKHRIQMLNSLLRDNDGATRFFIDADSNGRPTCRQLVQSFLTLQYDEHGNPETDKKDYRDMTHWSAAVGYGLYRFEKFRGTWAQAATNPEQATRGKGDQLLDKAKAIHGKHPGGIR